MAKKKLPVDKKELYKEIVISKAYGRLTRKAENMLFILAQGAIRRKTYTYEDDRHDCLYTGIKQLFQNWYKFDNEKYDDAFSYFTEVFKRGIAEGMNDLYKRKGQKKDQKITVISMNSSNDGNGLISI